MRQIQILEEQRIRAVSQAPEHMKEGIDFWYQQRQQAIYNAPDESKFDRRIDRFKQLFGLWRSR
jgi:hypothetical protein